MSLRSAEILYIVYDGACPFCTRYVRLLRLKEQVGEVRLVDARAPEGEGHVVERLRSAGCDLDDGMAIVRGDRIAHGEDCVHQLALMSTTSGAFNRFNGWVFRSSTRARVLYPILRAGRNAMLRMLGIAKMRIRATR
jgi:predicted DCC family thiol-disulfide oxidoreductase YuxK